MNENGIMAFGHPFFGTGPTSLGYTGAEIFGIQGDPFFGASKMGVPQGRFLGVITEDRAASITGVVGEQPKLVRISSVITDPEGLTKEFRHTVQSGLPSYFVIYSSLDATISGYWGCIDYMTGGSIRYSTRTTFSESDTVFETIGRGYDSTDFSSAVLFGEDWSGGMYGSWEQPVYSLLNRFPEHHLTSVVLNGRWSKLQEVVEVTAFEADPPLPEVRDGGSYPEMRPGDAIHVTVTTIDHATDAGQTYNTVFNIPEDAIAGVGRILLSEVSLLKQEPESVPEVTFEDALRAYNLAAVEEELSELYVGMYGPTVEEGTETGEKGGGGGGQGSETNSTYSHEVLLTALDTTIKVAPGLSTTIRFLVVRPDTNDAGVCDGSCASPELDAGSRDTGTSRDAGYSRDAH
jgi:hypothetical protein